MSHSFSHASPSIGISTRDGEMFPGLSFTHILKVARNFPFSVGKNTTGRRTKDNFCIGTSFFSSKRKAEDTKKEVIKRKKAGVGKY